MRKVLNRETSLDFPQCGVAAVLLISAALLSPPCLATEGGADSGDDDTQPDSTVTLGAGLLSKYAWRGLLLTDGPVIQPTVDVSHKGFVINVWCNMDLDDVNGNEREFNEIDLTLAYGGKVGPVRISGGVMHYTFPSTLLTDTSELIDGALRDSVEQPDLFIGGVTAYYGF